jgi:hypothetical protein
VIADLAAAGPDRIVVIGDGARSRAHPDDAAGTFVGFGVDVAVGGRGAARLPPALSIGAWLLDEAGWQGERTYVEVGSGADQSDVQADVLRTLLGPARRSALLVVADGSATRTEKAPRGFDPRSAEFDASMADALASGDVSLGRIDDTGEAKLAAHLHVGGLAAWRATARLLAAAGRQVSRARLLRHEAPYGVGYFAAVWTWEPTA